MRRTLLLALAAAVFVAALAGGDARAQPATTTIEVGDFYFCDPSFEDGVCETTVNAGDTVTWQWLGGGDVHSTTECGGDLDNCPTPHLWDSPVQDSGTFSFTFDSAGTFAYRCQVHPLQMRGVINVVAGQEETPSPTPDPEPEQSTPEATETPVEDGAAEPTAAPAAVPTGGGPPPGDGSLSAAWWAVAAGGLVALAGAVFVAARQRR